MVAAFVSLNVTIPAGFTLFLVRDQDYDAYSASGITDPNQLNYHILPKAYKLSQLPTDGTLITTETGQTVRFNVINGKTYINGRNQITNPDIQLSDGILHILDSVISLPAALNDPCTSCYKERTILEDVSNDTSLSTFYALLEISPVDLSNTPYSIYVPSNNFFTFGAIKNLDKYLTDNSTALGEFINLLLFGGAVYPVVAYNGDTPEISIGGYTYTFQFLDYQTLNIITVDNPTGSSITARPRSDGVYYALDVYLFNFAVTPPPTPAPQPSTDKGPIPTGVNPNSALGSTISVILLLLGSLVLFYQ